jgi:hypothetical protein
MQPFNEPFGFRIRHIRAKYGPNEEALKFAQSNIWKPPVTKAGFAYKNVQYPWDLDESYPDTTKWLWKPSSDSQKTAVTPISTDESQFFKRHKTISIFWAPESHTFLHVPFDCTKKNVEEDLSSDEEDVSSDEENAQVGVPLGTWRAITFHGYYNPGHRCISVACSDSSHQLPERAPERWIGTLMPSNHQAHNDQAHNHQAHNHQAHNNQPHNQQGNQCLLAGHLTILLGLVAFCDELDSMAILAILGWFPPSRQETDWIPTPPDAVYKMQHTDYSK